MTTRQICSSFGCEQNKQHLFSVYGKASPQPQIFAATLYITEHSALFHIQNCIAVFFCTLDAGLLARSQYSECPATGHLDTGFSWFPCVYKQMLRRFPTFQVATTCFSCSPPELNLLVTNFIFCIHVK